MTVIICARNLSLMSCFEVDMCRIVVFRSDKLEEIIAEVKRSFPGGVTA